MDEKLSEFREWLMEQERHEFNGDVGRESAFADVIYEFDERFGA